MDNYVQQQLDNHSVITLLTTTSHNEKRVIKNFSSDLILSKNTDMITLISFMTKCRYSVNIYFYKIIHFMHHQNEK